jgi:hypothetical protein
MSELNPSSAAVLKQMGVLALSNVEVLKTYDAAVARAAEIATEKSA